MAETRESPHYGLRLSGLGSLTDNLIPELLASPPVNKKLKKRAKWQDDIKGIFVLLVLYCLQGIPLGLIFGSLPFVMAEKLSYTDQATFSLAAYPYSLKLFWSPIVDVVYSKQFGRRKSWIFPMQILMGLTMIYISYHFNEWSGENDVDSKPQVTTLTIWFFSLMLLTATQDIAVDGWALTILSEGNRDLQAMCQTVGQTFGYALGFPLLLALNSREVCVKWLGADNELVTPESFLMICGCSILVTNVLITVFVRERSPTKKEALRLNELSIQSTYVDILRVVFIPNVYKMIAVLFTCKIAFSCVDSVTPLKLNEKGYPKELAGLLVFIYMPFELTFPFVITALSNRYKLKNMRLWTAGYKLRIAIAFVVVSLVHSFAPDSDGSVSYSFLFRQVTVAICYSFACSVISCSQCAFFARIADETIGGTYLTLLNTLTNLGGTWPKYFMLRLVDYFTIKREIPCPEEAVEGKRCFDIVQDGYYKVTIMAAIFGIFWILFVESTMKKFDETLKKQWTIRRSIRMQSPYKTF